MLADASEMIPGIVCCGGPIVVGLIAIVSWALRAKGSPLDRWARRTAGVRRGVRGPISSVYHFAHRNANVQINAARMHGRVWTQLHLPFPDRRLQLELVPAHSRFDLAYHVPVWRPPVGPISEWFRVRVNDPSLAQTLLDEAGQAAVMGLATWNPASVYVAVNAGHLMIAVAAKLATAQDHDGFVRLGLNLYDTFLKSLEQGIDFDVPATPGGPATFRATPPAWVPPTAGGAAAADPAAASGPAAVVAPAERPDALHCGFCQDELVADIVYCQRCQAPHHRECWTYSGICTTFGCGGTTSATRPPVAS